MKFFEMQTTDFRLLGRSLEAHYTLDEIMSLGMKIGNMTDDEAAEIVAKMSPHLLPEDYEQSHNRSLIRMAAMRAF